MPKIQTETLAQHRDWRRSGVTVVVVAHSNEAELSWADKVIKNFH